LVLALVNHDYWGVKISGSGLDLPSGKEYTRGRVRVWAATSFPTCYSRIGRGLALKRPSCKSEKPVETTFNKASGTVVH